MAEISILMPSLREKFALLRIEDYAKTNPDIDYEIIIVSPFPIAGDRVIHVLETEASGTVPATNLAFEYASGNLIIFMSDDVIPQNGCLRAVSDFVKQQPAPFLACFNLKSSNHITIPLSTVYKKLYAGWGCLSVETIEKIGGLFDASYKSFWADPDLALRVWENGGRVALCSNAKMMVISNVDDRVSSNNYARFFASDLDIFLNKWHCVQNQNTTIEYARDRWLEINEKIYTLTFPYFIETTLSEGINILIKVFRHLFGEAQYKLLRNWWRHLIKSSKNSG